MRVLLDSCVSGRVREILIDAGHDVDWVGDWKRDPGDEEILDRARSEERVIVTLDKDFGELAVLHKHEHAGIVRLVGLGVDEQGRFAMTALEIYAKELTDCAIVTVSRTRVRVRPGEQENEGSTS